MDTGLNQNKTELAVLVLAVALKVLADSNGLRRERLVSNSQGYTFRRRGRFTFLINM